MTSLKLALIGAKATIVGEEARNAGMAKYYQDYISEQAKILEETQRQLICAQRMIKNQKRLLQEQSDSSNHLKTLVTSCNKVAGDALKKKRPLKKELIEALEYIEAITKAPTEQKIKNYQGLDALRFMSCKRPGD